MIIEKQAEELNDSVVEVAHRVEILCPNCKADVTQEELDALACSDCGSPLENPEQNVEIHVTSVPLFAITFGG